MDNLRKKRFQLSSLSPEIKEELGRYIKHLGASYLDKQIFTNQVSHVVCGKPNRSEKYLSGCVSGRWVLTKEYIQDSYKQGKWLPEENYEWHTNCLPLRANNELKLLYSAPTTWRNALKGKKGAFENWTAIVCVKDVKMKKAYERLLKAGCAKIVQQKAAFQDKNPVKEITHVFVEPDLKCKNVLALEKIGIPCLSPDYIPEYIIQASKEQTPAKFSMNGRDGNILATNKQPPKSLPHKRRAEAAISLGKENGLVAVETNQVVGVKGIKRKAPDCEMCLAKRQKKMDVLFPNYYSSTKSNDGQKARTARPLLFPGYVSSIVESYVDEGRTIPAIATLSSSLSKNHVPTSECLYMVINDFLLSSPTKQQAVDSYNLLRKILHLHPASSNHGLYLNAFTLPNNEDMNTTLSQFVSKVVRMVLESITNGVKTSCRVQENAQMFLQFLNILFQQDAGSTTAQHQPMIVEVLWPDLDASAGKEFVAMCHQCIKLAANGNTKLELCQIILDFLSLGLTALRKLDDEIERDCKETLAQQLFVVMSKNGCSKTTKLFLQGCHSSWLKMRVTELMLDNFDKRLISQKSRGFLDKNLSLMKIVSFYFFLLPKTTERSTTKTTRDVYSQDKTKTNKESSSKGRKRNEKGETCLHLACIHNNVTKVEELLKQDIDVNATDYAGWTSLHEACNHGHVQCVEKILNYHEQTNKVDLLLLPPDGTTVLHDAVVNNHLPVVKLLLKSGGLKLLNAKTASGQTACDVAVSKEMTNYLKSEMDKLKQNESDLTTNITTQEVVAEQYNKILNKHKNKRLFVTMEDCENYLFLVSQLLQAYVYQNMLCASTKNFNIVCTNCKIDFECHEMLSEHVDCLEKHVKLVTQSRELSVMCKLYLNSMKLCLAQVK